MRYLLILTLLLLINSTGYGQWTQVRTSTGTLYDCVSPVNSSVVWVSSRTSLIRTVNGGTNWTEISRAGFATNLYLQCVYAFDSLNALVAGNVVLTGVGPGIAYKTTNAGATWTQVYTQPGNTQFAINMTSREVGYMTANTNILKTTDGGSTWDTVHSSLGGAMVSQNGIYLNGRNIWCPTNDGYILRSSNEGASWDSVRVVSELHPVLYSVAFDSEGIVGFCGVGNAGKIHKTIDGGKSWFQHTPAGEGNIPAIVLYGNNMWYSGGQGGDDSIRYSSDKGETFTNQFYARTAINDIEIARDSSTLWAAGPGKVFKYTQLTSVGNNQTTEIKGYKLHQNFPNPFNPSTSISYELSAAANVSLKVYDITGKLINELVNTKQNAGTYNISFDGSDLSSGIYYYTLTTGEFTQTRKMLLVK